MAQGAQTWSTKKYLGTQALQVWQELVSETLISCDISPVSTDDFSASMTRRRFGTVTFQEVHSSGSQITRTREQIRRDCKDDYFVIQQRAGSVIVEQSGRTAVASPGDCLLISASAPYKIQSDDHFVGFSMSVPKEVLQAWLPDPDFATARALDGAIGWGRALSATLWNFLQGSLEEPALPPSTVVDHILAQLAIALGADTSSATRHQRALLSRLGQTLSDRYREPDFDPSQLAEEHGLSKRYVHLLFARAGTSFGKELAKVRLESAKRLLDDRRFDCVDIMEIALRCGFRDSSGFSRRFRGQYGHPPSAYRRQARAGAAASL